MTLFDIDKIHITPIASESNRKVDIIRDKFIELHSKRVASLYSDINSFPLDKEIIFIETYKAFNAFTFVLMFLKKYDVIDCLNIGSYSLSNRIINSLINYLLKGRIKEINITVSDTLSFRMPKIKDLCDHFALQNDNFNMFYTSTHKKITCVNIKSDFFVIEGSGNYNENSSREQYIFLNSKKIYDFRTFNLLNISDNA